jgi:hypothetical protein
MPEEEAIETVQLDEAERGVDVGEERCPCCGVELEPLPEERALVRVESIVPEVERKKNVRRIALEQGEKKMKVSPDDSWTFQTSWSGSLARSMTDRLSLLQKDRGGKSKSKTRRKRNHATRGALLWI